MGGIKFYMRLKDSIEFQEAYVEGPNDKTPADTVTPRLSVPPKSPSVAVTMFSAPYEVRVKALKSQPRFYGMKNSIRQTLAE